jgi:hypothetical protein
MERMIPSASVLPILRREIITGITREKRIEFRGMSYRR